MPIELTVDKEKCLGVSECGECINICPMDVFDEDEDGKSTAANAEACEGCESCVASCETEAITLEGNE